MYPQIRMNDKENIRSFLITQKYRPDTISTYRRHLELLHRWLAHKNLSLEHLTPEQFLDFLDEHDWGKARRRQSLCALRAFVGKKYGSQHPIMELQLPRSQVKTQRTLTVDEVKKVLDSISLDNGKGARNYALVCLMIDTGLRASEVCRLEVRDLFLDKLSLQVEQKGGTFRMAAFTPYTRDFLEDWLTIREVYARDTRAVFVGVNGSTPGKQMTRHGLRANFRRMAKKAGVDHFSPHSLRRTMATIMIGVNHAPNRITQISGGWSSSDMVDRYTRALGIDETRPFLAMHAVMNEARPVPESTKGNAPGYELESDNY